MELLLKKKKAILKLDVSTVTVTTTNKGVQASKDAVLLLQT